LPPFSSTAFADAGSSLGSNVTQAEVSDSDTLTVSLSMPETWQADGMVLYRTRLTIMGISSCFGYQVQIEKLNANEITVTNLIGGVSTEPTYKDGSIYLAVISSEPMSGEIVACEITCGFLSDISNEDRVLVVRSLKAVTSISSNTIVELGPEPAAAVLILVASGATKIPLVWFENATDTPDLLTWCLLLILFTGTVLVIHTRLVRNGKIKKARGAHYRI